jgi:hypothetical protein
VGGELSNGGFPGSGRCLSAGSGRVVDSLGPGNSDGSAMGCVDGTWCIDGLRGHGER